MVFGQLQWHVTTSSHLITTLKQFMEIGTIQWHDINLLYHLNLLQLYCSSWQ